MSSQHNCVNVFNSSTSSIKINHSEMKKTFSQSKSLYGKISKWVRYLVSLCHLQQVKKSAQNIVALKIISVIKCSKFIWQILARWNCFHFFITLNLIWFLTSSLIDNNQIIQVNLRTCVHFVYSITDLCLRVWCDCVWLWGVIVASIVLDSFVFFYLTKMIVLVNASKRWSLNVYKMHAMGSKWGANQRKTVKKLTRRLQLDRRSVVDVEWLVDWSPPGPVMGTTEPPVLMPWPSVDLSVIVRERRKEKNKSIFTENNEHKERIWSEE